MSTWYKEWACCLQECEGFMAKGIAGSGAGFDAPSVGKLGGRGPVPIHNPPSHQLKSLALKVCTIFCSVVQSTPILTSVACSVSILASMLNHLLC